MPGTTCEWSICGRIRVSTALRCLFTSFRFANLTELACAQELEPRAYANTPAGMNFLISGYVYSKGAVGTDPSVPLEDAQVKLNSAVLAYVRTLDLWGMSGKPSMETKASVSRALTRCPWVGRIEASAPRPRSGRGNSAARNKSGRFITLYTTA
jgi:hypothetical protein